MLRSFSDDVEGIEHVIQLGFENDLQQGRSTARRGGRHAGRVCNGNPRFMHCFTTCREHHHDQPRHLVTTRWDKLEDDFLSAGYVKQC